MLSLPWIFGFQRTVNKMDHPTVIACLTCHGFNEFQFSCQIRGGILGESQFSEKDSKVAYGNPSNLSSEKCRNPSFEILYVGTGLMLSCPNACCCALSRISGLRNFSQFVSRICSCAHRPTYFERDGAKKSKFFYLSFSNRFRNSGRRWYTGGRLGLESFVFFSQ